MSHNPYGILFEPIQVGPITLPNRFYAVPHATGHSPMMPNGSMVMRETKAMGGWGTVCMQLAEIDPSSNISNLPMEAFWDDQDVASHARMVEKVKAQGAVTAIELAHTGLRSRNITTGQPILGPSSLPNLKPQFPGQSKAMDKADIKAFRQSHRQAVKRAKQAGYDMVYVYAAHDASLLTHFLNPTYNQRTDEYGGCFENRVRLLREVLEDTMEEANGEVAVAIRMAVHDFKHDALAFDNDGRACVEYLADLPDLWDVNVAGWPRDSGTSRFDMEGFQEAYTSQVKQITNKPVVGVGRFTSADAMVSQIKRGVLDLIGGSRPSIADPYLPNKIRDNRIEDIRECIGCNICVASDAYSVPLRCTQNPTISEEWRRGWHPEEVPKSASSKNVLIVGSGPAGLEAGLTLAKAGHEVTIAEGRDEFGGRVSQESQLMGLSAWARVKDYRLYQLQQMANVNLFANSQLTAQQVLEFGADEVVLATGASWRRDGVGSSQLYPIAGFAEHALTPDDVYAGRSLSGTVVIYDDDHYYHGNVLAAHLAKQGLQVHLVCPLPSIAEWMGFTLEQPRVIEQLLQLGVHMHPNTKAVAWGAEGLQVQRADTGCDQGVIKADSLLSVTARIPDNQLCLALQDEEVQNLHCVGDAEAPNIIQAAVLAGHTVARNILQPNHPWQTIYRRERPMLLA